MQITCPKCGATVTVTVNSLDPLNWSVGNLAELDQKCPTVMARSKTGKASDYACDTLANKIGHVILKTYP